MFLLIQLSWRNIWRHRRRTFILTLAVAIAVGGVLFLNTIMRGMQTDMENAAIDALSGHLKVHAPDYLDDPGAGRNFTISEGLGDVAELSGVRGAAARLRIPAVVMSERETRGVQLVGVDIDDENISFLRDVSIEGESLLDVTDRRLVIGRELVEDLRTALGRRVVLIAQGADGVTVEVGFRIAGIFDTDSGKTLEQFYAFTGLAAAQDIFGVEGVTELSIRLDDAEDQSQLVATVEEAAPGLDVKTWQDLSPQLAAIVEFTDMGIAIWYIVALGALSFGLVNTLVASVMERVRETGVLRAIGMKGRTVVLQIVLESVFIMAVGVVGGVAIGLALYWWLQDGIDLSQFAEGMELWGVRAVLRPELRGGDVVNMAIFSAVLGVLASIYPAMRTVRLAPLDALRK